MRKNSKIIFLSVFLSVIFFGGFSLFINSSFAINYIPVQCTTDPDNCSDGKVCTPNTVGWKSCQFPSSVVVPPEKEYVPNASNITSEKPDKPGILRVDSVTKNEIFTDVSGEDNCITNTSGLNYFIPNKDQTGFDSFKDAAPQLSGISVLSGAATPGGWDKNPDGSIKWSDVNECHSSEGYTTCSKYPSDKSRTKIQIRTWSFGTCGPSSLPPAGETDKQEVSCDKISPCPLPEFSISPVPFSVTNSGILLNGDSNIVHLTSDIIPSTWTFSGTIFKDLNYSAMAGYVTKPTISINNTNIDESSVYIAKIKVFGGVGRQISIFRGNTLCGTISDTDPVEPTTQKINCRPKTNDLLTCQLNQIRVGYSNSTCGSTATCADGTGPGNYQDVCSGVFYGCGDWKNPTKVCCAMIPTPIPCMPISYPNLCAFDNNIQCSVTTYSNPY